MVDTYFLLLHVYSYIYLFCLFVLVIMFYKIFALVGKRFPYIIHLFCVGGNVLYIISFYVLFARWGLRIILFWVRGYIHSSYLGDKDV